MKPYTKALFILLSVGSTSVFAQDSVNHSGQASKHSALAASEGLASTATVASAAVAVPVIVVAGTSVVAGSVISEVGTSMADSAQASHASSHSHQHTLVITERTITADPAPNQVVKQQQDEK
ncbi:hypothetical protein [Aliiglaciecola litoralis]|uniref:Uncharacterized protein n=1 Tax=Aliiglaciecola litoralis TaxID=582857 RepID=A0ABN1LCJ5_9ALTE